MLSRAPIRSRCQAGPCKALRLLPWGGAAEGGIAARHGRRGDQGRSGRAGRGPRQVRRKPALSCRDRRRGRRTHAPAQAAAAAPTGRSPPRLDRFRRRRAGPGSPLGARPALVLRPAAAARLARGPERRVGTQPDRPIPPRPAGARRDRALARSRSHHAAPPRPPRPDRPAALARRGRRLPRRRSPRRLRAGRRPPARLPAFRRAMGKALAGPRPLRRLQRLQHRRPALDLEISRLGHRRPQPQHAVRRVRHRATGRRPPARRHARPEGRHRVPPQHADQPGRRHRPRAVPHRVGHRPREHHRHRVPRPDRGLLPVPRPQVRPDHAEGILPALRLLQQRRRARPAARLARGAGASGKGRGRRPRLPRRRPVQGCNPARGPARLGKKPRHGREAEAIRGREGRV